MGIFEKFRSQPRWKHADPAVRIAAIYDTDDRATLSAVAREDGEPRVRRAAVLRLDDSGVLFELLRTDPDADVRADAQRRLVGLAAETDDPDVARSVAAQLQAAGLARELVVVARESRSEPVKQVIVRELTDARALGAISRQASDGATRLAALARVDDDDELAQIAVRSEHTDTAVGALARLIDPAAVNAVAQRGRNKVAVRRARARERLLEEASRSTPVAAQARAMSAEDRQRGASLVAEAERLVAVPDADDVDSAMARLRVAWAELQADADVEAALQERFDAAIETVREAADARAAERAAEHEQHAAREREAADRVAVCEAIEALEGDDALDRFAELKVRWDALPPVSGDFSAALTRRFQNACRLFDDRERRKSLAAVAAPRLETLATDLEQLLASEQPLADVLARWRMLRRDADVLREMAEANPAAADRVERAVATLEEKEQEQQQLKAKEEQEHLKRLQQLCKQVETLAAADALTLKAGDRALNDIREALDTKKSLPSKADRQEVTRRLEAARALLAPRVQELRDADEWQRWANLQVQEDLVKQMEALVADEDFERAARRMRELQGRWKTVALAPRTQGEAMWRRFRTAQEAVYGRTSAFMAAQQEARGANAEKKRALCEQAEALSGSTDWVKTASALQALQAEWKTVGPAARGQEKALWDRFRAACDGFFSRRQEDLKKRKDEWSTNLSQKEALCAEAEALAQSTDWDAAAAQLKRLQAQWKSIGPVRRSKSEVVWQRFRTACDAFFDRYKHRDQIAMQEKAAARSQVIAELEALVPPSADAPAPENLYDQVQAARAAWQQAPELARTVQQDLAVKYHDVLSRLVSAWPSAFAGTDLDPDTTRRRMEKLLARVEQLTASHAVPAPAAAASPAELLAQRWRERLAANTISGGQGKNSEDARWKEAEQEVRSAQQQWMRLGPVPAAVAGPLNERFQRACRKFYDGRRRAS